MCRKPARFGSGTTPGESAQDASMVIAWTTKSHFVSTTGNHACPPIRADPPLLAAYVSLTLLTIVSRAGPNPSAALPNLPCVWVILSDPGIFQGLDPQPCLPFDGSGHRIQPPSLHLFLSLSLSYALACASPPPACALPSPAPILPDIACQTTPCGPRRGFRPPSSAAPPAQPNHLGCRKTSATFVPSWLK